MHSFALHLLCSTVSSWKAMITVDSLCSAMLAIFSVLLVLWSFCLFVPSHQSVLSYLLGCYRCYLCSPCSAGTYNYFHEQEHIYSAPGLKIQHRRTSLNAIYYSIRRILILICWNNEMLNLLPNIPM